MNKSLPSSPCSKTIPECLAAEAGATAAIFLWRRLREQTLLTAATRESIKLARCTPSGYTSHVRRGQYAMSSPHTSPTPPTPTYPPPSYPNMMELWKDETGVAVSVADGRHSSWGTWGAAGLTNFVCRGKGPGGCWYRGCLWGGRPSSPSVSFGFVSSVISW